MNDYTRCKEDCRSCQCKEFLPGWCDGRCSSCQWVRECPCCNRKVREQIRRGDYHPAEGRETINRLDEVQVGTSPITYPGPWQQRPVSQDLVRSMMADLIERGQRSAIKVRVRRGFNGRSIYELVNGEIRLRAAKALGWSSIRAVVKELDDWEAAIEYLLDNLGERKMPWEEVATGIMAVEEALFRKDGRPCDSRRLGQLLGRSKDWVNDHKHALRLAQAHSIRKGAIPYYKLLRPLRKGLPFRVEDEIIRGIVGDRWTLHRVQSEVDRRAGRARSSPKARGRWEGPSVRSSFEGVAVHRGLRVSP